MIAIPLRLGVLLSFAVAASAGAQVGTDSERRSDDPYVVTIRGCAEGSVLTATEPTARQGPGVIPTVGSRFRVVGDRDLLDELRGYDGHQVDLIGVLSDDPASGRRQGARRQTGGGTRVWISNGRSEARPRPFPASGEATALGEVEIRAVIPVSPMCPV